MQAINLKIPGKYYDSQIYSGLLYLWTIDGSILTIDWNKLIQHLGVYDRPHLEFAAFCAFQKGSHLYSDEWQRLFKDEEMKSLLIQRFEELARQEVHISRQDLKKCIIQEQRNPFSFPHADSLFYYSTLYVSGNNGVFASRRGGNKNPINPFPIKHWDAPILSMAVRHQSLALAAGSEGLFEAQIDPKNEQQRFKEQQRSPLFSSSVRWLYDSLFSSSYQGGYFVDIEVNILKNKGGKEQIEQRIQRETVPANRLFDMPNESEGYTWGVQDKLCYANTQQINVIKYKPKSDEQPFDSLKPIQLNPNEDNGIVCADSAPFGYVIEYDDRLLILDSELNDLWLNNEPVNWRVFPDSIDYTNHLHVIYDDHLSIYSFVQDYFVDQNGKVAGIQR